MLVTYVPSPWRTSTTWMSESARIASRSELRETLRRAAKSLSFGSSIPRLELAGTDHLADLREGLVGDARRLLLGHYDRSNIQCPAQNTGAARRHGDGQDGARPVRIARDPMVRHTHRNIRRLCGSQLRRHPTYVLLGRCLANILCIRLRERAGVCGHHVARDVRRPLPHVAAPRRLRRDEPRPRLLRGVRGPPHRRGRRARRARVRVHDRARQRRPGRGDPRARARSSSADVDATCRRPRAGSGGGSCTTRSCAGSARRRASCTWRSAPWSTRCGTSPPSAPASRCGSCWPS